MPYSLKLEKLTSVTETWILWKQKTNKNKQKNKKTNKKTRVPSVACHLY